MHRWWCVRHGGPLAGVDPLTAIAAVQPSLGLYPLGDWTDDAGDLVVFPQDAYPDNTGLHDYTRAWANPPPPRCRHERPLSGRSGASLVRSFSWELDLSSTLGPLLGLAFQRLFRCFLRSLSVRRVLAAPPQLPSCRSQWSGYSHFPARAQLWSGAC